MHHAILSSLAATALLALSAKAAPAIVFTPTNGPFCQEFPVACTSNTLSSPVTISNVINTSLLDDHGFASPFATTTSGQPAQVSAAPTPTTDGRIGLKRETTLQTLTVPRGVAAVTGKQDATPTMLRRRGGECVDPNGADHIFEAECLLCLFDKTLPQCVPATTSSVATASVALVTGVLED